MCVSILRDSPAARVAKREARGWKTLFENNSVQLRFHTRVQAGAHTRAFCTNLLKNTFRRSGRLAHQATNCEAEARPAGRQSCRGGRSLLPLTLHLLSEHIYLLTVVTGAVFASFPFDHGFRNI